MRQRIERQTAGDLGQKDWQRAFALGVCRSRGSLLRQSQPGKEYFTKLEHKHGKAKALTVLAHKLGRAVYYMLTREQAFDLHAL